jgi:hypothetical protein
LGLDSSYKMGLVINTADRTSYVSWKNISLWE